MSGESYIYFSISGVGDMSSIDVENLIPLKSFGLKEHKIGEKYISFRIQIIDINEGLERQLLDFINLLSLNADEISKYGLENNLYMKLTIVVYEDFIQSTGVYLNKRIIEVLNSIGAEFEYNIYK